MSLTIDKGPTPATHAASNDERYALNVASGRDRLRLAVAAIRLEILKRSIGPDPLVGLLRFASAASEHKDNHRD